MKKMKIAVSFLFLLIAITTVQTTDAQTRHKPQRVRVVKRNHVTVVRVHPRVYRRAHIRYAALPRWGAVVTAYPAGAVVIRSGVNSFYFYNGIYYAPRQNNYVIVHPVRGLRIQVLPVGYRRILIGPRPYFYYYGTFYAQADNSDEYEVTDAPEGAIVDALPDGYEVKTISGNEYYYLDGVYYAEVDADDIEGGTGYKVVKV
jgi:Family of unknown function (DUF6515)